MNICLLIFGFPSLEFYNSAYGSGCNAKLFGDSNPSHAGSAKISNLFSLFIIKSGIWAMIILASNTSALFLFVFHVVLLSSKKQMIRIYTFWIITLVKHAHPFRNFFMCQNPHRPRSQNHSLTNTLVDMAVSVLVGACKPHPTFHNLWTVRRNRAASFYFFVKSGLEGCVETIAGVIFSLHKFSRLNLCHAPGWFNTAGATPYYTTPLLAQL